MATMASDYDAFLARKALVAPSAGFDPCAPMPPEIKDFQRDIVTWACRRGRSAIFAGTGLGKAQPIDTPILTPQGWRLIGSVAVGDEVIGSDGRPTLITGVFPQGARPVRRVSFSDGVSTRCDPEHLWAVRNKKDRYRGKGFEPKTLIEIEQEGLTQQEGWRHFIPMVSPVEFPERELPLDPYLLGVLLGDGGLTAGLPYVSSTDDELLLEVQRLLPRGARLYHDNRCTWRISSGIKDGGHIPNPVTAALRDLGLMGLGSGEKFIPEVYKFASIPQRVALLQGLLDTDGHARPDGNVEYLTVSERLASDAAYLIQSLGGKAPIRTKKTTGQLAYRMSVAVPAGITPFRLSRKANVYRDREKYQPTRAIVSMEDDGTAEMVCISVAAPDRLYVTEHCIVTHNTIMELAFADQVVRETGGEVLVFTPLAVAEQTVQEATKFGIEGVSYAENAGAVRSAIAVTNYERRAKFDLGGFAGIVCDESGILKAHDGKTRLELTEACSGVPYLLCGTATPSPNDFTELGQHAEFLGVMSAKEMLSMFFVHDASLRATGSADAGANGWRLKRHARDAFWAWVASWAVMIRHPRDLGYEEPGYDLPPLKIEQVAVDVEYAPSMPEVAGETGMLFPVEARTMLERLAARRSSIDDRVAAAVEIVKREPKESWLIWCKLNAEAEAITDALPYRAVNVEGKMKPEMKIENLLGFKVGNPRIIVTKGSIAGRGLNWQNCARMIFLGLSDSFEEVFQAIRRCWRFGQMREVQVHMITSELEGAVVANVMSKEARYEEMAAAMAVHMKTLNRNAVRGGRQAVSRYEANKRMELPAWM